MMLLFVLQATVNTVINCPNAQFVGSSLFLYMLFLRCFILLSSNFVSYSRNYTELCDTITSGMLHWVKDDKDD